MQRRFEVFGDPVEILLTRQESNGTLAVVTQTCKPGGGPPPHIHVHEDEFFQTLSGRFAIFDGNTGVWNEIPAGQVIFGPKGSPHAFRNCGDTVGTIQILISSDPAGRFEDFLAGLSQFNLPQDIQAMVDYSAAFGITYPTLPPPTQTGRVNAAAHEPTSVSTAPGLPA